MCIPTTGKYRETHNKAQLNNICNSLWHFLGVCEYNLCGSIVFYIFSLLQRQHQENTLKSKHIHKSSYCHKQ